MNIFTPVSWSDLWGHHVCHRCEPCGHSLWSLNNFRGYSAKETGWDLYHVSSQISQTLSGRAKHMPKFKTFQEKKCILLMALYMPPFWQALLYEGKYNMYIYISEYENEQMYSASSGCGYLPDRWLNRHGAALHLLIHPITVPRLWDPSSHIWYFLHLVENELFS